MDISHSRPHKVYIKAPVEAFEIFAGAVEKVAKANPFSDCDRKLPKAIPDDEHIVKAMKLAVDVGKLSERQKGYFVRYVMDMECGCSEIVRVIKPGGKAIFVIGDSTINGIFVRNSKVIESLSKHHGLEIVGVEERKLPSNRRYLPPPSNESAGKQLKSRMRKEVILDMKKAC